MIKPVSRKHEQGDNMAYPLLVSLLSSPLLLSPFSCCPLPRHFHSSGIHYKTSLTPIMLHALNGKILGGVFFSVVQECVHQCMHQHTRTHTRGRGSKIQGVMEDGGMQGCKGEVGGACRAGRLVSPSVISTLCTDEGNPFHWLHTARSTTRLRHDTHVFHDVEGR